MKFYYQSFLMLFLLITTGVNAQSTITGTIFDQQTKEPLAGAMITIPGTQSKTVSNPDGSFALYNIHAIDSVIVRFIGYREMRLKVEPGNKIVVALQSSAVNMQEVVVTANREATLRSQVPLAISKLGPEIINDAKPTSLPEIINKIPGVIMVDYNNEQHSMSIRQPMGMSEYYLYLEDGLPIRPTGVFNPMALIEMNIFAISSVEVVKGPVSSLYGPEAVGGAINFITQKPTAVPTARIGIQANNFGYKRVQYGMGGMITKKFGVYAGGFYSDQKDGWMTYSDFNKNALNIRMDYNFSPRTKLYLSAAYNNYYNQLPGNVDSLSFYNKVYTSNNDFNYKKSVSLRSRLTLEHRWNETNNSTLTAFYRNNTRIQNSGYSIRWISPATTATGEINDNTFKSYGILAQHSAGFKFLNSNLIGGLSFDFSPTKYWAYQIDLAATLRPDGKSVEKYTLLKERPDIKRADYDADLFNTAAYLQYTIAPVKGLKITTGLRYDKMAFDYNNYLDLSGGSKSFHKVTSKIGATYDFGKDKGIYINYSQGFSPPQLSAIFKKKSGTPANKPPQFYYNLSPAQFDNYEIGGWASLWENKVYLDVAFYTMYGKNELLAILQSDNSFDYQSAGKTFHQGIELGLNAKPLKSVSFRLGGTYAVHRYDEFILSLKSTDLFKDASGYTMPTAPNWIANSEITYKPQRFMKGFRIALEWQIISSYYQNQINTVKYNDKTFLGVRGVSILNLHTGYEWKGMEGFVNVMNLTDELYANTAYRGNNPKSRSTYTAAAPRTIVFGIQYNFTGK